MRILSLFFISLHCWAASPFREKPISIPSDAGPAVGLCNLGASYLKPKGVRAEALVVFVHGSGVSNRDEELPDGRRPFKDLSSALSQSGFASLRFDRRGSQPECIAPLLDN